MSDHIEDLNGEVERLEDEIRAIADTDEPTDEQIARLDELVDELPAARQAVKDAEQAEERAAKRDALRRSVTEGRNRPVPMDVPQVMKQTRTDVDPGTAPIGEVRDAARKIIEEASPWTHPDRQTAVERALFGRTANYDADKVARRLVYTENDAYRGAFVKLSTGRGQEVERELRRVLRLLGARRLVIGHTKTERVPGGKAGSGSAMRRGRSTIARQIQSAAWAEVSSGTRS